MKYIGLDVHVKTTVCCCLDETGKITERGKTIHEVAKGKDVIQRLQTIPGIGGRALSRAAAPLPAPGS